MGDCEIENCKCCKEREHAWRQYGRVLEDNEKLRAALEFYGDKKTYESHTDEPVTGIENAWYSHFPIKEDNEGDRARQALKETGGDDE